MTPPMREQVREAAMRGLETRKKNPPPHIDNAALHAGEPMHYYCRICGWLAAVMHEEHTAPVPRYCHECAWMIKEGWIEG